MTDDTTTDDTVTDSPEIPTNSNPQNPPTDDNSTKIIADLQAALARSQADYQNLIMRTERDKAEMIHFLTLKIFAPLLTQVDNLERAIAIKSGIEGDAFVDGVRSVQSGLVRYLESQGVKSFESVGHEIDPDRHDVLSQSDGEEGKIIQEFEKGYLLGDRVLRHAKVVVGNGNIGEK